MAKELYELEHKANKLEYYMTFLTEDEQEVIRLYFFDRRSLQEISDELGGSVWSIKRRRDSGVKKLTEMYGFIDELSK